ncbi:solute carrier family 23 protein [Liquorilactobacillus satsumensis]|uniref:Uracil permease n=1 Tax=Liquorilactobacillus satsumensis DSM 16230 = JCM 12392 TaxID=1423801 RepID=A0A0R1V317_9LACO|nr:solute carrier family 23 protein [Liquorilactobacillus satsumensis]KRL99991.1 Uracil permease [Liquorilactobacillus satsumensis DSM 16230 = JCM 12392]MCP9311729.1 uracil permease [Liquorilactobacillus satsumensis]MCP9328471.1 uracil permease [Liquorilactobacillus satsumensis]MCP9358862.1 uracil permease [Liquorilactobacillus satsumensis]
MNSGKKEKFRNDEAILDIGDRPQFGHWLVLSIQHLFTMFGATVLVPLLVGINPSIALFSSGVGTLVYILCTNAKIPAYLGSSFAFIVTMQALMKADGYPAVGQGAISAGLVYVIVSLLIGRFGSAWVDRILPPVVVGPIIIVIGLSLATTAANDAMLKNSNYDLKYFGVAIFTLLITIIFNMFLRGFSSMIPVLLGIICGYLMALATGIVNLQAVAAAKWFSLPAFNVMFINYHFKWYPAAIIGMAPIAFVTMTEHMGHIMVLNKLTKRNFFKDPGLHRTLFGDGLSSVIAGFVGGPPTTSYGENIGVLAMTKVHSVWVLGGAALFAILFSFVGKVSALIQSIPSPVIGGISFLLFGMIASNGLRILVDNHVNYELKRNLIITSVILVIGIGGTYLKLGSFQLTSIALATLFGIVLNLVLPVKASSEK